MRKNSEISLKKNLIKNNLFKYFGLFCTLIGLVILAIFIIKIFQIGLPKLNFDFLSGEQSRKATKAGIKASIFGTLWIFALTAIIALPIGIAAGIYLEEYVNKKSKIASFLEVNISNLAGVPSVIYGLLGMAVFVYGVGFGQTLISAAFTLAFMILPIIIVTTREALKAVPNTIREAAYGLGASKWQTIWSQLLPASLGGIMTGSILSLSRIVGETAPLILVGAAASIRGIPSSPFSEYTVLPIQIYEWSSKPHSDKPHLAFYENAAAAIVVLLVLTFLLNGIAIYLRNRWQSKVKW